MTLPYSYEKSPLANEKLAFIILIINHLISVYILTPSESMYLLKLPIITFAFCSIQILLQFNLTISGKRALSQKKLCLPAHLPGMKPGRLLRAAKATGGTEVAASPHQRLWWQHVMRIIAPLTETLNLSYLFFCFWTKQVHILSLFAKNEH